AFISQRSLSGRVEETVRQFAMGPNVPSAALEGGGLLLAGGGLLAGIAGARRSRERDGTTVLAVVVGIGLALPLALAVSGVEDRFLARNVLGVWIALAALVGLGLS